jgi:hypothetical protein
LLLLPLAGCSLIGRMHSPARMPPRAAYQPAGLDRPATTRPAMRRVAVTVFGQETVPPELLHLDERLVAVPSRHVKLSDYDVWGRNPRPSNDRTPIPMGFSPLVAEQRMARPIEEYEQSRHASADEVERLCSEALAAGAGSLVLITEAHQAYEDPTQGWWINFAVVPMVVIPTIWVNGYARSSAWLIAAEDGTVLARHEWKTSAGYALPLLFARGAHNRMARRLPGEAMRTVVEAVLREQSAR